MPINQNPNNMQRLFQTAGSGQAKQGTGFTNLNRLLQTNEGSALGSKVAGDIKSQVGGVSQQLGQQTEKFGKEAEEEKKKFDEQQRDAVIGRFTGASGVQQTPKMTLPPVFGNQQFKLPTMPTQAAAPTEAELAQFQKFRSGEYTGPKELSDTGALAATASGLAQQTTNLTPAGTQELLRRSVGGDRYTQGQSRLDALLMGRNQEAQQQLRESARQAQGLGQQISQANLAAQSKAQEYANLAKQFGAETENKLQAGMSEIDTKVQAQLKAAQDAENQRLANIQAVQNFAENRTPKLDAAGNVVKDQYGKIVYDTTPARGGSDIGEQAQKLQDLLRSSGAQSDELTKLFGTASGKDLKNILVQQQQRQAEANQDRSSVQGAFKALNPTDPSFGSKFNYLYSKNKPILDKYGITADDMNQYVSGNTYYRGILDKIQVTPVDISKAGLAGKAFKTGKQEDFYKQLSSALSNAPGAAAQNLTEQGVASATQRANYEALNKLLGKTSSEAKYKTDAEKYQAGKVLLNPEQIKNTLGY